MSFYHRIQTVHGIQFITMLTRGSRQKVKEWGGGGGSTPTYEGVDILHFVDGGNLGHGFCRNL